MISVAMTKIVIPPHYASALPTPKSLAALKQTDPVIVSASSPLHRAAWNPGSVLPLVAEKFYRFGPPDDAVAAKKPPPYWWLYIADVVMTCIYEAGFCAHDKSHRGHFYIPSGAVENGQIASFVFPADLRLLDLRGETAFNMGIYDLLSHPNHEWCQWFAYQLVKAGFFTGRVAFHGILYSSRKNRGKDAIALFSEYVNHVRSEIQHKTVAFKKTAEYKELKRSKFLIPAP